MSQTTSKEQLITDIEKLLNSYDDIQTTSINPTLLSYMNEDELKSIIDMLLTQKENIIDQNQEWLEQFKKYKN